MAALRTLGGVGFRCWVNRFPRMLDLVPSLSCQSTKNHEALRIHAHRIHAFGLASVHTSVEIHRIERGHKILACSSTAERKFGTHFGLAADPS